MASYNKNNKAKTGMFEIRNSIWIPAPVYVCCCSAQAEITRLD